MENNKNKSGKAKSKGAKKVGTKATGRVLRASPRRVASQAELQADKFLCMSPWTHLHLWPDGRVLPCCMASSEDSVGQLGQQTVKEIFNSAKMRDIRSAMLEGKRHKSCARCFELEDVGGESHRNFMNQHFGKHFAKINSTTEDGVAEVFLPYWDIRFSNVCNFKCRTCGLPLSSSWYDDDVALWGATGPRYRKIIDKAKNLWTQLKPHVEEIEEVYFVGGEPMLMEEHWYVLNLLVKKKLNHVRLRYNTNFSFMTFKDYDVINLWNSFPEVAVQASLDGSYARGEFLRKGQVWSKTVANRERLLKEAPHVNFTVNSTISLFNIWHITDFHREWFEKGYIDLDGFLLNMLISPEYYRAQLLAPSFKEEVRQKVMGHIYWMSQLKGPHNIELMTNRYMMMLNHMFREDRSDMVSEFHRVSSVLDDRRRENYLSVFPELARGLPAGRLFYMKNST